MPPIRSLSECCCGSRYGRRSGRKRSFGTAIRRAALLGVLLILAGAGCAKKSRPAPPPQIVVGTTPDQPEVVVDPNAPLPEIDVHVDPLTVVTGEAATLEWQSRNAQAVVIDHDIGTVDPSGRLKVFPEVTTSYLVRAEGPGGSTEVSVRVEVRAPDQLTPPELEDLPITQSFATFVKPVFFDFDSGILSEEARLTLEGNVRWLKRADHSHLQFVLEGHCDRRGSEGYNLALGDLRAQTVKAYLIQNGIDPNRVSTLSLGEERPVVVGDDEQSYALNRRVQFVMVSEE